METFKLPKLHYLPNALEPYISENTINFHYGKHLATYIGNLNKLIEGTPFKNMELENIIRNSEGVLYNNAAQAYNHIFFFNSLCPKGGGKPGGALLEVINSQWGSFDAFKAAFSAAALSLFGSGWVWLSADNSGKLFITQTPNAKCPLDDELTPLLTLDVWEHAYYLDYQNQRGKYIENFWNIVAWKSVEKRYHHIR